MANPKVTGTLRLKTTAEYMKQLVSTTERGETALYFLGNVLLARAEAGNALDEVELDGVAQIVHAISHALGAAAADGQSALKDLAEGGAA